METNNPGTTPQNNQTDSDKPVKPKNPAEVSINFTPKIPILDDKEKNTTANNETAASSPKAVSVNVPREDLGTAKPAAQEKKGFLGGLFGKKDADSMKTKPSSAWGDAVDAPKDIKKETATVAPVAAPVGANPAPDAKVDTPPTTPLDTKVPEVKTDEKQAKDFFESSALQEKSGTSKLVENIATQKAQLEQPKAEDLLGKQSTILEESIEQESLLKKKKKLRVTQFLAVFLAIVAITVNGYLYYQLSPGLNIFGYFDYNFESNLRNDVFNLNESLKSVQTDLNKYRYLSGQLYLNQFGYESTRFIDGMADLELPGSTTDKVQIQALVTQAKEKMPVLLAGAQENLTHPITVQTFQTRGEDVQEETAINAAFQKELRVAIGSEKNALKTAGEQSGLQTNNGELAIFDNAIKLVGNRKLIDNLNATTIEAFKIETDEYELNADPAQRAGFRTYIDNLLASTKVNLATITNLRNSRIKWSDVIERLETITNQVNAEHNSGLGANNASKFVYSSYDFNSESGKISINASNTTRSGTNREVVTYLIEALEASPEFKNVSNRNFPLSRTKDANGQITYTLNFKIDMDVETGAFSKMNSPIADLQNGQQVAVVKVPVRRK